MIALMVLSLGAWQTHGQEKKAYNFSVSSGIGLFHYINTLKGQTTLAKENGMGFSLRLLWEPEHRISLGIETGYYNIYSVNLVSFTSTPVTAESSLSAIPFYATFKVRVFPHFYFTGGTGTALLLVKVTSAGSTYEDNNLSLANSHISALYRRPISDRFDMGGELKFLNFGKTEDYGFCILAEVTYNFRFRSK